MHLLIHTVEYPHLAFHACAYHCALVSFCNAVTFNKYFVGKVCVTVDYGKVCKNVASVSMSGKNEALHKNVLILKMFLFLFSMTWNV